MTSRESDMPLPEGFEWQRASVGSEVRIVRPTPWTAVATVREKYWGGWEARVGDHRRVYITRGFRTIEQAQRWAATWLHRRLERVLAELAGEAPDPTEKMDPCEHHWFAIRDRARRKPRNFMRSAPPANGTCREARRRHPVTPV